MKKLVVILFLFIFYSFAFADANFILQNNQVITIKFDDVTPDIWIKATSGEKTDSYKIEAIGPASNIDSVVTDVINGKNIVIAQINLGDPGGRAKTEERNLYVFEVSENCKIKLLCEKSIINMYYYPSDQKYIEFQRYYYTYDSTTKEITIFDSHAYVINEVEKIKIEDYLK